MSFDYERLLTFNELSEIIRWHNQCLDRLKSYRESHPYLLAPNVARMMEDNLKENVQMLYKELNNMNKPKQEQRRHVCRECHGVFAAALPGGLCDECRPRVLAGNQYEALAPISAQPTEEEVVNAEEGLTEEAEIIPMTASDAAEAAVDVLENSEIADTQEYDEPVELSTDGPESLEQAEEGYQAEPIENQSS